MNPRPVVIDTNVLISAALSPGGSPAQLVRHVLRHERVVFSEHTHAELVTRLYRPKFDRYLTLDLRKRVMHDLEASAMWVVAAPGPRRSRDADDDKFIDTALAARAFVLVTGDKDLLELAEPVAVAIATPAQALALLVH